MGDVVGAWNPGRVLEALGRIGYHPVDAVLDIVDNSVSAGATRIAIDLEMEQEEREGVGRRRVLVSSFSVIDNGKGMNPDQLTDALSLGSSDQFYVPGTLSKFGLGLKSASSSLGRRLTVTTRSATSEPMTAQLDMDRIIEQGEYVFELREASKSELAALDEVALSGPGTIVRVDKVRENAMTDPVRILEELRRRTGVVYLDYIRGERGPAPLAVSINTDPVHAVDPLFVGEIPSGDEGKLDETTWDGQGVKWLLLPQTIQLTPDGSVTAQVTMTQLPHPPSVKFFQDVAQVETRNKYMIGAGNYGFYVYRHGRLVSWADDLDGMVSRAVELYAFRGRLDIDTDADDILNINVRKSHIQLSDLASMQLNEHLTDAIRKSRAAWNNANSALQAHVQEGPTEELNAALDELEEHAREVENLEEATLPDAERQESQDRRKRATERQRATPEESQAVRSRERWQWVDTLDNNELWRRGHDPEYGSFVRVNRSHRFIREMVDHVDDHPVLLKALGLLLFSLARGEYRTVISSRLANDTVEEIMDEFREQVSGELSESVKRIDLTTFLDMN